MPADRRRHPAPDPIGWPVGPDAWRRWVADRDSRPFMWHLPGGFSPQVSRVLDGMTRTDLWDVYSSSMDDRVSGSQDSAGPWHAQVTTEDLLTLIDLAERGIVDLFRTATWEDVTAR